MILFKILAVIDLISAKIYLIPAKMALSSFSLSTKHE